MAVFVDPKTGERYDNVPDEEAERAQSEFGLITPDDYAARQEAEKEGQILGFGRKLTSPLVGAVDLGMKAGILDKGTPEEQAEWEKNLEKHRRVSGAHSEVNPVASLAGDLTAMGTLGAVSAGAGSALAGAAGASPFVGGVAGLAAESGVTAVAQEAVDQSAVDAVTGKRDFSVKAALMQGLANFALGGIGAGLGHVGGKVLGLGDEAAAAAHTTPEPSTPSRNWVAELDPGEAPAPLGGRRPARSAGAAAAANQPYGGAARAEARAAAEGGIEGAAKAANDVHPFQDDMFDAAARDLRDGNGGKGMAKEAEFLAEHSESLTDLAATNTADALDDVRRVMKEDLSVAAKREDARALAGEWTEEQLQAQRQWSKETVEAEAEAMLTKVDATRKAAADVQAGRAGAREGGAEAINAAGVDSNIQKTLRTGLDDIRRSDGVERALHVDDLKRNIGKMVKDLGKSTSLDEGTKIARGKMLGDFYETLRVGLEDEGKFGRFGPLQAGMNEAFTGLIEAQGRLDARLTERLGDTWLQFGQAAKNSRTKASAVAQVMRSSPLEQRELYQDVADVLDNTRKLAAARAEHGLLPSGQLTRLEKGLSEFTNDLKFARTLQVAKRVAKDAAPGLGERIAGAAVDAVAGRVPFVGGVLKKEGQRALEGIGKATGLPAKGTAIREAIDNRLKAYSRSPDLADIGTSATLPRWLQDALRGHGGQVAGVAGLVGAGALLAPGQAGAAELLPEQQKARDGFESQLRVMDPAQQQRAIGTAESFARIQRKTEQRVQGAVTDLFSLAKDPRASPKHRSPEARQLDARAQDLDVPRHLARFMGKRDDPVVAFKDKAKTINEIVRDPAALSRRMAANLGDLPTEQPEIFASMVGQTMLVAEYLHERMPGNAGRSALDPGGYPPSFEEISEWAGHWTGAIHPLDTLDDLASNDLVPEQMEAVQALHPEGYSMFQATAMKEIHALSRKRGTIPLEALEQIDGALGLDGAGEPILSSAMADLIGQATAKEAERLQEQAKAQQPQSPMVSQSPSRLASSSLSSIHPE